MNKIDKLIRNNCPNGVIYKKLRNIGDTFTGLIGKNKNDFIDGNARYITYTNIYNNPSVNLYLDDLVKIDEGEKQNELIYGDVLIAGSSENIEDSGMISVVCEEPKEKIYLNSFCFGFRLNEKYKDKLLPSFSKYIFRSAKFRKQITSCSYGVTRYNLNKKMFLELTIPIPPLVVQEEIVKILDKMNNDLITNLDEELNLRLRQYEYWENKLLDLQHNRYPVKRLGDIAYYSKDRISYEDIDENNYISVENLLQNKKGKVCASHPPKTGNSTKFVPGDILIGNIRPYLKKIWLADCVGGTNGDVLDIRVTDNNTISSKFLFYILSSDSFFEYDNNNSNGAKMPRGSKDAVMNFEVPVPTFDEQLKIVEILDRFEKFLNDIDNGIPAEIELRKQQYEYYRNKLLSFEEVHE